MHHKNIIFRYLCVIILSLTANYSFSQLIYRPQAPLSVKWRQVQGPNLKLIFPTELENQASILAAKINALQPLVYQDLNPIKTTYPILLHNRGTSSNAFVQIAPQTSHFYTTAEQGFDSQNWLSNLAIHELRHMVQFDKLAKPHSSPALQELQLAQIGIRIPLWFLEGDAVYQESYLTQAGRGKQPEWIMPFRTALLSNQTPSYSKTFFGSHKHYTPGYYQLGYLMQSLIIQEKGKEIIPELFEELSKPKLEFYNFSKSLKRTTGLNRAEWYTKNIQTLKSAWEHQANLSETNTDIDNSTLDIDNSTPTINPKSKFATDYLFPFPLENQMVLCLKQGKSDIPSLIILNQNQEEEHLRHIGFQEKPWIHYAAGKIVWVEYRANPRYKQESYSVLCIYDIKTRTTKQLSFKSRYFSPSLSADGKKIILIENDLALQSHLVEIESASGKILNKYSPYNNTHLENPSYDASTDQIVFITVTDSGKSIVTLDLSSPTAKPQIVFGPLHQQLGNPKFNGDKIYFNAHLNGLDNIYEISPHNKEIFALSASKYGAFNAQLSIHSDSLLLNDYNFLGQQIKKVKYQKLPVGNDHFVNFSVNPNPAISDSLLNSFNQTNYTDIHFESKAYAKFRNVLNFHSLSLKQERASQSQVILRSENLLNTVYWENGISYEGDLRKFGYKSDLFIRAFYPMINIRYDNRPRGSSYFSDEQNMELYPFNGSFQTWRENRIKLALSLPLSFNFYHKQYALNFEVSTFYANRYQIDGPQKDFLKKLNFPMSYQLNWTHAWRKSNAEIAPKFAQVLELKYAHQPFSEALNGDIWTFQSSFYFPGIAKRHSFSVHANAQRGKGIWRGLIEINPIYGYYQIQSTQELKQVLLLNYRFPLSYPDLEINKLAYIKQINLGLFSHYENPTQLSDLKNPRTFGIELNSKLHLFQYQPLIDFGTRFIFVNQSKKQNPILEFTFNYSL